MEIKRVYSYSIKKTKNISGWKLGLIIGTIIREVFIDGFKILTDCENSPEENNERRKANG